MIIVRRILTPLILTAALWLSPGCDGFQPLFDSTNLDPHPPVITSLVSSTPEIFSGEEVFATLSYFDPGGDIEILEGIDLNDNIILDSTLPLPPGADEDDEPQPLFFPGSSGTFDFRFTLPASTIGVHRIKIWLVDSKETRSEPAFIEVTVNL